VNAPDRNLHDQADGQLRQDAIDNLTRKLEEGDQVGRCTFRDLIDSELNGDRAHLLLDDLDTLIRGEGGNDTRDGFASRLMSKLIERYLLNHPDLIEEEAATIEAQDE
jgi:hypothetical protein